MQIDQEKAFQIHQLSEMPDFLRESCLGMTAEIALSQPKCDKDFLQSHFCHLVDCEHHLYGARIDRLLNEKNPRLEGVDVLPWPIERQYHLRDADEAIRHFIAARYVLLERLKALEPEQWAAGGTRFNGAECDVREMVFDLINHDRDHRVRIAKILREFIAESTRIGT
jgi:hypothetical protein